MIRPLTLHKKKTPSTSRIRNNLTRLTSGSILAQIILAASTPLLTRIFAPDAFGFAALFSAAYALLIPLVTLKYDQAIIIPKTSKGAASIGVMVMIIATINCVFVGLGIIIWLYASQEDRYPFIILPVALWLGAAYTIMQQWSSRLSNYTHYANSQVINAFFNVSICIGAGLAFSGRSEFMIIGFTTGIAAALAFTIHGFGQWPYKLRIVKYKDIKRQFKAYKNFPTFVLPTTLVTILGTSGITFIISHYYQLNEVGVFSIANRALLIPAGIVGGSLAEAIRSEFASRQRANEPVSPIFTRTIIPITALAGVLFGAIFIVPDNIYEVIFGKQYTSSSGIARALILAAFSHFVCTPFMYVFAILRRAAMGLVGQALITIIPLFALFISAAQATSLNIVLFTYSLLTCMGALIMLILVYRECKIFDARRQP